MRTAILCVVFMLTVTAVDAWAAMPEVGSRAPTFDIKDQFGKQWKLVDLVGQVTVLVVADTDSGRAMGPWVDALKIRYPDKIRILGLLDLHSVPGIGRGIARSRIRRETKDPMMLDFAGKTAQAYGVSSKTPGVIVIDKNSVVQAAVSSAHNEKSFEMITSAVDKAASAK